eukprot:CAMPEP_0181324904 /NCGR_PEP_ID=MMETSP1101-20121128/20624_1 /TAXON_ID=46948 /ORGANISM="Rhodomonas abbreviata, Strain Caron Lab Isolate" /LENGTH=77 /DNA_ID=CAMNT_0023433143 /DNA_START=716 /DNA_END=949 /DNA_ORIENTATION=+
MFQTIRHFASLDATPYDADTHTGNVFADFTHSSETEWPAWTGTFTTAYDPFGDGPDANHWATTFDTNSTNPFYGKGV